MSLRSRSDLREQQHIIIDEMVSAPAKLIVSAMGSGKTGATLTALRDLLDSFQIRRILIVAPLRVARDTWPDEIGAWAHSRLLSYAVCVGTEGQRREALRQSTEILIINREQLPWLWKELDNGTRWDFDCVVVDESSMFKAGKKRTKNRALTRFGVLAQARKKIDRIYLLTGTPAPNGIADLWGQIYLLDQGERLGATQKAFYDRWFDINRYSFKAIPRSYAESEITKRVADIMVSLPALEIVPPPVFIPVKVTLPSAVKKEYDKFERTLVTETYDVEAVSRGVLTNKLLQMANSGLYKEDGSVAHVHTAKLDALDELIERAAGDPVLIWYGFKFDVTRIREKYPDAVLFNEDSDAIKKWNRGEIKIGLAHPASLGHGTNLQYGGHIAIWFGLTWSLELYQQANARLPRPGQKHIVAIYQIIAEGTVDEDVLTALDGKASTQDSVTRAVLHRIRGEGTIDEDIFPEYLDPKIALQNRVMESTRVDLDLEDLLG